MMRTPFLLSLLVPFSFLAACSGSDESKPATPDDSEVDSSGDSTPQSDDGDGDGVTAGDGDCDDENAQTFPGNPEVCDGIDNNCNRVVDEGMPDVDSDGTADCVDAETCDGVDNDGDGSVDEDFADGDNNGVADCAGTELCDGVDNNADGVIDEGYDFDGDGYTVCGSEDKAADCDDQDADISPEGTETAGNQVDDDCDGMIDEGNWAAGDLAITEIMANPTNAVDPEGEWFELYNTTNRRLTLNGLTIESDTGELHQITNGSLIVVDAGDFVVLGINNDPGSNGEVTVAYEYTGVSLSNESDALAIWAGSVELDRVMWDDGATMPDGSGASMMTDSGYYDATLNDDANAWCMAIYDWDAGTDFGSPGQDNGLCSTTDHDHDGFNTDQGDCDDTDPTVYPGAYESDPSKDNDCDGVVEWGPVAIPTVSGTSSLLTCSPVYLDGTGSYDPDGSALTYSWTLESAPANSVKTTSDINTTTSAQPTFNPDKTGTYTFGLVVNDGGADSLKTTVDAVITQRRMNQDPVAVAGSDQNYDSYVTCTSYSYGARHTCSNCSDYGFTLSALGSTDPDGDELTYSWTVLSGSYISLSSSTDAEVTATVSGVPATYGVATPAQAEIQLTVTDCMGAVSTDTIIVNLNCTGQ